jgi:hypothetical protein
MREMPMRVHAQTPLSFEQNNAFAEKVTTKAEDTAKVSSHCGVGATQKVVVFRISVPGGILNNIDMITFISFFQEDFIQLQK